jgi:EmrB/QacA subfamily drug resistance transporter
VLVASFMLVIDISAVTVALPAVRADLGGSFEASQWVLDAYAIALAAVLLPAASVADSRGRKRTYLAGLGLFTSASLACALAPSILLLDLARAAQGIGAAGVFSAALPLIAVAYPEAHARSRAIAAFGATIAMATAAGPFVGGAVTEAFGWSAIFLLNVPLGFGAVVVAAHRLAESADASGRPVDVAGGLLLGTALLALVFALLRGNHEGWAGPPILGAFATACAFLAAFLLVERRVAHPMVDLALLRSGRFAPAGLSVLSLGALIGALVVLAAFLQDGLHHGPLRTGIELLPVSAMSFVAALATRALASRLSTQALLVAGLGIVAGGLAAMALIGRHGTVAVAVPGMVLAGFGWGAINVIASEAALAAVPPSNAGMATGTLNALRQVGLAAGIAGIGAVFQLRPDGAVTAALLVAAGLTAVAAVGVAILGSGRLRAGISRRRAALICD